MTLAELLCEDRSLGEIAQELGLSLRVCKHRVTKEYELAGVTSRLQYVIHRLGLVAPPFPGLPPRAERFAQAVFSGKTNRELAKAYQTSPETVRATLHDAFNRLGVWSRVELVLQYGVREEEICQKNSSAPTAAESES